MTDDFLALTSVEGQHRFGGGEQGSGLSKDTTLRELLNRAATKLDERHDLDPRIEAGLRWMIGENLRGVGEYARAVAFLERCVALRQSGAGTRARGHVERAALSGGGLQGGRRARERPSPSTSRFETSG